MEVQIKKSTWTGKIYQAAFINFTSLIFNVITLYLFYPLTLARKQRWICRHSTVDGRELVFLGRGRDLIIKWFLWWILVVITISIFGFFLSNKMQGWLIRNTHFKTNS